MVQGAETEGRSRLQKEKDDNEARYQIQLTALNENLSTLRTDYSTSQTRLNDMEKVQDDVRGEKLGEGVFKFIFYSTGH